MLFYKRHKRGESVQMHVVSDSRHTTSTSTQHIGYMTETRGLRIPCPSRTSLSGRSRIHSRLSPNSSPSIPSTTHILRPGLDNNEICISRRLIFMIPLVLPSFYLSTHLNNKFTYIQTKQYLLCFSVVSIMLNNIPNICLFF